MLCVKVSIQRVPAYGLIDSGVDITIIGGKLLRKVATVARLKKDFMKPDRVPRTYDQQPFTLDGRMDLDITFGNKQMTSPIYIKMDAYDQLLLSEGVCRQLGIISYHPEVEVWHGGCRKSAERYAPPTEPTATTVPPNLATDARVPTIRVRLVQSVQLLPHQSQVVEVACTSDLAPPERKRPL